MKPSPLLSNKGLYGWPSRWPLFMLVIGRGLQHLAFMSKKKRVTLTEKDGSKGKEEAKVYPNTIEKRGKKHLRFIVRGWKKDGKWQRKQFSDEAEAEAEAASVNVNLKNQGENRSLVLTTLTDSQVRGAEDVFRTLGNAYTMEEVLEFFLKHNRPPDFTISLLDGMEIYLDAKKHAGVRAVTLRKPKGVLTAFSNFTGEPDVHTVTEESIIAYLKSLRANDKIKPAKKKTWNNHRNELASFFKWACERDKTTNRPWTFNNPAQSVLRYSNDRIAEERPAIEITSTETAKELLSYVMTYKKGKLAKFYALAYFAGIRPDIETGEISKIAEREDELINLATGRIAVPAAVSKTKFDRPVNISENLKAWLEAYKDLPIIPTNCKNDCIHVREKFGLQKDETRHSFISYHIALHRSIGDAAMQAGNSETMIKKHYLTFPTHKEGKDFFSIVPDMDAGQAVFLETLPTEEEGKFKVI